MEQLLDWTLGRTADIPKSQRFTFGQRIDSKTLDCMDYVVTAVYSSGAERKQWLSELNLALEQLRVLWRIVQGRTWISQRQLIHVNSLIDEIGRMAGGWMKSA